MLTVNQLAIQSRTPAHVVRYYVRIGLIQPAGQKENGYRLFTPLDANRIRFIRMASAGARETDAQRDARWQRQLPSHRKEDYRNA